MRHPKTRAERLGFVKRLHAKVLKKKADWRISLGAKLRNEGKPRHNDRHPCGEGCSYCNRSINKKRKLREIELDERKEL